MTEERTGRMSIPEKFRDFWQNTKRIVRVARRPTFQEVRLIARVSGIGILLVGAVAYLMQILGSFTFNFFDLSKALVVSSIQLAFSIAPVFAQVVLNPTLLLVGAGIALVAAGSRR